MLKEPVRNKEVFSGASVISMEKENFTDAYSLNYITRSRRQGLRGWSNVRSDKMSEDREELVVLEEGGYQGFLFQCSEFIECSQS